ncbi:MAG TPA: hypothetical protein VI978_00430 [Candidatus Paceibacterota bacterium]
MALCQTTWRSAKVVPFDATLRQAIAPMAHIYAKWRNAWHNTKKPYFSIF